MTAASAIAQDALRAAAARLPGGRLADARDAAITQLLARGTPTVRQEDWKYTDLAPVIEISNNWLASDTPIDDPERLAATIAAVTQQHEAHWLVIANGKIDATALAAVQTAGVDATLLSESGTLPGFDAPLADLNVALLHDGLRIDIAQNQVVDKPIGLLVIDSAFATDSVAQSNINIAMAANSSASFVEYHVSSGEQRHYANTIVNLDVKDGAQARYLRLQSRAAAHSQTGRLSVRLDRDSAFNHCAFDLGGKLVRNDLEIAIDGPGAAASFHGLYLAGNDQHIDNHTRVDHKVGPATSEQEYRGILGGSARCIWNGKAIVHAGADGTDAEQANHNLLLSENAEIDAKPELEIYADEVKCAHGTTVGQLDQNALFYLRTRGIDKRAARRLMTRAFAEAVVAMTPLEDWREAISEQVIARLNELTHGEDE